jgi:ribosomal protein S18 acetylase RimI-like enzyme
MSEDGGVPDDIVVRRLRSGDESLVMEAAHLFDDPPQPRWVATFLEQPTHHILIALRDGHAVGFVTGVEMTHPDKGTEMFVYELGVTAEARRQGVARALLDELTTLAKERRCYDMWVLTDADNLAALSAYRASGATAESEHVMLTWNWS